LRIVGRLPDVEYVFQWTGVLVFKTVHNFLVAFEGDAPFNPQLSEIEAVEWFQAEAARRTIGFKNARQTLDAAIGAIDAWQVAS
jgi:8-oxo-dGTP pyrophosphatase MutT (NUDIX family)